MKRRNFVYGTAALGGELLINSQAFGQAASIPPARLTNVLGPAAQEGATCQYILFTGQSIVCLYAIQGSRGGRRYAIAATTLNGDLLWSYPLPLGSFTSLGTHGSLVVVCSVSYFVSSQRAIPYAVLLLDPKTGVLTNIGPMDVPGEPSSLAYFAGDSLFFMVSSGQGEIWNVDGAPVKQLGGIAARSFSNAPVIDLIAPRTIGSLPSDGTVITTVSVSGGAVEENAISADVVSSRRAFYQSQFAAHSSISSRMGIACVISAAGGDGNGGFYALLSPFSPQRVAQLVRIEPSGVVSSILQVQLPVNKFGRAIGPMKLVISNSELGVVSYGGITAWYPRAA